MMGLLVFVLILLVHLGAGWTVLVNGLGYTIAELRREVALNGVGDSVGDPDFNAALASAYLFVLRVWPVSVWRKVRTGRVVGRDFRDSQ